MSIHSDYRFNASVANSAESAELDVCGCEPFSYDIEYLVADRYNDPHFSWKYMRENIQTAINMTNGSFMPGNRSLVGPHDNGAVLKYDPDGSIPLARYIF